MTNTTLTTTFLKEWTPAQFKAVEKAISRHFSNREMKTTHGNYPPMFLLFTAVSDRLGLAYTSSSDYAGYWICNTEVSSTFPSYKYIGFALSDSGIVYAILWTKDEKEKLLPL